MYAWLDVDENDNIKHVSCKKFIYDNPLKTHAIIGTMFFRKAKYFIEGLKENYKYNIKYSTKEFANDLIDEIIASKDLGVKTCTCKKGDVIIFDGTGIHRGKPLEGGQRYAITNYYRFDPEEILPYKNLNSIKIKN